VLKYTEWSQIQALNFLLDVKYYKSKRDNMNNNQSFSDCSQSKGSLWVERILRVVLASQRKMSEAGAKKSLQHSGKINEGYNFPSLYIKKYKISQYNIDGFPVGVFNAESKSNICILYLHGGGYVDQPLPFHYTFLNKLSKETGLQIHLPLYPKSPKYTFKETVPFVFECYKKLLETFKSENVVVMGDSAGASIALVLSQYIKSNGFPQPKHTIMFSPCFDISLSIENNPNLDKDPMFYKALLKTNFLAYAGEEKELVNPLASPEFGDLKDLAPMSVFIGTKETLYPYVQRFFEKIETLGIKNASCYPYYNLLHVFPLMPIPEAKDAREKVIKIITT